LRNGVRKISADLGSGLAVRSAAGGGAIEE
jgi:hypothetical protein